jgi:hypothetical protein
MLDNQNVEVVRSKVLQLGAIFAAPLTSFPPSVPRAQLTERLRLIPYQPCHVDRYHTWMEDEWIRGTCAS